VLDEQVKILTGGDVRLSALSRHSEGRITESYENTHRTPETDLKFETGVPK
jgi:hypothetical protein